jgi:hypothetical protein
MQVERVLPHQAPERIGLSRFEHSVGGDPMRGLALGHLQEGGTALSDIRLRMVIAGVLQLAPLLGTELHLPAIGLFGIHRRRMVLLRSFVLLQVEREQTKKIVQAAKEEIRETIAKETKTIAGFDAIPNVV